MIVNDVLLFTFEGVIWWEKFFGKFYVVRWDADTLLVYDGEILTVVSGDKPTAYHLPALQDMIDHQEDFRKKRSEKIENILQYSALLGKDVKKQYVGHLYPES